jgi:dsRNA-specific ribonuclease
MLRDNKSEGEGWGPSRKAAEQEAARQALIQISSGIDHVLDHSTAIST